MTENRCRFCGANFRTERELRRHYVEAHRIDRLPEEEPGRGDEELPDEGGASRRPKPGPGGGEGAPGVDRGERGRDAAGVPGASELGEWRLN